MQYSFSQHTQLLLILLLTLWDLNISFDDFGHAIIFGIVRQTENSAKIQILYYNITYYAQSLKTHLVDEWQMANGKEHNTTLSRDDIRSSSLAMFSQIVPVLTVFCIVVSLSVCHGLLFADNNMIGRQDFITEAFSSASSYIAVATTITNGTSTSNIEHMCQNGALMSESAVPGAYSSVCMGLPERVIPLPKYRERCRSLSKNLVENNGSSGQPGTIIVQQQAGGSGNTGMTVWNSGILLTRLLDAMVDELQRRERQRRGGSDTTNDENDNAFWMNQDVIELGCGTSLCSIAAQQLGARSVIATDGNPGVLLLGESNIKKNCYYTTTSDDANAEIADTNPPSLKKLNIRTEPLQWGFLNSMDYSECASFVIGADLTYNAGSWRVLAETIATILKTKNDKIDDNNALVGATTSTASNQCYALYLSIGHEGFNVNAEMDGFLSVCKSFGLVILPDGVEGIDVELLLLNSLSESEKKILAQSGGFRVAVLGRKELQRL
jgi:hypothetical protein